MHQIGCFVSFISFVGSSAAFNSHIITTVAALSCAQGTCSIRTALAMAKVRERPSIDAEELT